MAYITSADVEQRMGHLAYVQLTDDAGTGSANEAIVAEARSGAEGEVNSYLGR
jgi:phage gp36-like protein